jgi:tight adherence protein C
MTAAALHLVGMVLTAIGLGVGTLLAVRSAIWCLRVRKPEVTLPVFLRILWLPAQLLTPLTSMLMSERLQQRVARTLEAADLYPGMSPATWLAMRVASALATGLIAWMLTRLSGISPMAWVLVSAVAGFLWGGLWLRSNSKERERRIVRDLPAYLDLLTVCVEAGATLTAGIRLIVDQAPQSPLRGYFDRVLREVRGGRPRAQAFVQVATIFDVECLSALASTLAHAESSGMSLGQVLRAQSEQRTAERFSRAERLAMQAPVKLLGPLIFCIFPCTFIVLAVPIVARMVEAFSS